MKMQGQHEALELLLQERCSRLERENTQLRRQNEALQRSQASYRERTSQERAAELALVNQELLQRDRILEATATAANALLTVENFDEAVNTALQIIGEALDTDRVAILDHFQHPSEPSSIYWRILYEWNSPDTVSQISHPELAQGSYEGIEDWYELCSRGQGISCLLEEMPEPFRKGQAELGVKALNVVPIFVEGKFWECVGFDDCREAKRRSAAELAVLKTAAACIGGAIQRDRVQLRVRDNGQGFDMQHQVFSGFGLKGMQQRCDRIAAHLEINTQPGAGTEIIVIAPNVHR